MRRWAGMSRQVADSESPRWPARMQSFLHRHRFPTRCANAADPRPSPAPGPAETHHHRNRLRHHRPTRAPGQTRPPGQLDPRPLVGRNQSPLGPRRDLRRRPLPDPHRHRAPGHLPPSATPPSAPSAPPASPTSPPPTATTPPTAAERWPYSASPEDFAGTCPARGRRPARANATDSAGAACRAERRRRRCLRSGRPRRPPGRDHIEYAAR